MNATSGVPWICTLNILDSVYELSTSVDLSLSQILGDSEEIGGHSLMILNRLLDDGGLWEGLFDSFAVEGEGGSVEDSLLSISKPMLCLVEFPIVLSILLLAWLEIAVCLSIHV